MSSSDSIAVLLKDICHAFTSSDTIPMVFSCTIQQVHDYQAIPHFHFLSALHAADGGGWPVAHVA